MYDRRNVFEKTSFDLTRIDEVVLGVLEKKFAGAALTEV
jgi:hypothetical protein